MEPETQRKVAEQIKNNIKTLGFNDFDTLVYLCYILDLITFEQKGELDLLYTMWENTSLTDETKSQNAEYLKSIKGSRLPYEFEDFVKHCKIIGLITSEQEKEIMKHE